MNPAIGTSVINVLLTLLPKELGKQLLDQAFDWLEDQIADSSTEWDDAVLLPIVKKARDILDIPDQDG